MKKIIYQLMHEINCNAGEMPNTKQVFFDVEMDWNEANEDIARREAYNGEYIVKDDGEPEPIPTEEDQLRADVDYLLMMQEG